MRTIIVRSRLWLKSLAKGAKSLHLELVPQDPKVHGPARLFFEAGVHRHGQVVHPPAAKAADVVVPAGVAVEAGRMAARVDLADHPVLRELLEVAVDRAEADPWDVVARVPVHPVRGGMVHRGANHFQDQLPLARLPVSHEQ